MSEGYSVQQICENGHQITYCIDIHPEKGKKFCPDCGASTLTACPSCNEPIQGSPLKPVESWSSFDVQMKPKYPADVPSHCHNCGEAYPWTKSKTATAKEEKVIVQNDPVDSLSLLFDRFHLFARQLQIRYASRQTISIEDEYDVK